jgi:transposase
MTGNDLYYQILGLATPWRVRDVELDIPNSEVRVYVEHDRSLGQLACDTCGRSCPGYDTQTERRWRHLDTCQFMTYLISSVPRVECPVCGVRPAGTPWTEPSSHFTLAFECLAITVLQATKVQRRAADLLRLSDDQVRRIMHRAVDRGLARRDQSEVIARLTMDEKAIAGGHSYVTVLGDGDRDRVLDVIPERTTEAAKTVLKENLSPSQLAGVQSVSMDMWKPFAQAAKQVVPNADVVHDRYHVVTYLNKAVDDTRKAEHARLSKEGASPLAKSKYLWLKNPENLDDDQKALFLGLMKNDLETPKAWGIKETFRDFFSCTTISQGTAFFENWYEQAVALKNSFVTRTATMLQNHLPGLLAYIKHKTTNARAEALNSKIQALRTSARGYRRFANFRIAILFFFGQLQLRPEVVYPYKTR